MYKVSVNNKNSYQITYDNKQIKVNEDFFDWDVKEISENYFHIIREGKSYRAEVVSANHQDKTFTIKINGSLHEVAVKDKYDVLLEKLGMTDLAAAKVNEIKAPMPGLILDIKVSEGEEVKKGTPIMILEAMKMENILKSPGDGVIKTIKVKKGDSVEKNQILVQF